ncbi:MAG: hypothetical protein ABUL62_31165 [Myxococcales bacterium]
MDCIERVSSVRRVTITDSAMNVEVESTPIVSPSAFSDFSSSAFFAGVERGQHRA